MKTWALVWLNGRMLLCEFAYDCTYQVAKAEADKLSEGSGFTEAFDITDGWDKLPYWLNKWLRSLRMPTDNADWMVATMKDIYEKVQRGETPNMKDYIQPDEPGYDLPNRS